ncbi:class III extradiol ring-cleavage dioxygenase family protein [Marinobacter orientalis]|uniref:Uncharacterized protein n=1 Tax=Marinobacter orientalis TaxID=1928859 RepID=A0A7Y0RB73_9GAMM|nr:hypothetical protein [Marinobacter orientalis]NMT63043.1 hypothetical protein [Marinobacter orientalis]TGX51704.1 hypothetical protein DIT72_06725 [Marinobacter orientalis]
MTKLPVLYLSCETEALAGPSGQASLRRLIRQDLVVNSVAFITSEKGGLQPEIFHQCGEGALARRLQSDMGARGFDVAVRVSRETLLEVLTESMMQLVPMEVIELRLNTGMTSERYRDIGHCLEALRDQGVLLICLDRLDADGTNASYHQPHDSYIRNLIRQWEDEQRWVSAMSKSGLRGNRSSSANEKPVVDPTLCVLNTAFSLGGMKAPQRLFGFSMNENSQSLAGYSWMQ